MPSVLNCIYAGGHGAHGESHMLTFCAERHCFVLYKLGIEALSYWILGSDQVEIDAA